MNVLGTIMRSIGFSPTQSDLQSIAQEAGAHGKTKKTVPLFRLYFYTPTHLSVGFIAITLFVGQSVHSLHFSLHISQLCM